VGDIALSCTIFSKKGYIKYENVNGDETDLKMLIKRGVMFYISVCDEL
jgi:hypothetical protein